MKKSTSLLKPAVHHTQRKQDMFIERQNTLILNISWLTKCLSQLFLGMNLTQLISSMSDPEDRDSTQSSSYEKSQLVSIQTFNLKIQLVTFFPVASPRELPRLSTTERLKTSDRKKYRYSLLTSAIDDSQRKQDMFTEGQDTIILNISRLTKCFFQLFLDLSL